MDVVREATAKAVAGAIGLAASLSTIVAIGGAIQWQRFHVAGLPADQAVAEIPRDQLIVIGANALGIGMVVALALVMVAYAFDPKGQLVKTGKVLTAGNIARSRIPWVLVVALALVFLYVFSTGSLDDSGRAEALVVAVVLVPIDLAIAHITKERFLWFGLALFLSGLAFTATVEYVKIKDPEALVVQAGAMLRNTTDKGFSGLYVAHNDKHVVLARPGEARLYVFSCKEVTSLAIGGLRTARNAIAQGSHLLSGLRAIRARAQLTQDPLPSPRSASAKPYVPVSQKAIC
jgi:hypothetical protein